MKIIPVGLCLKTLNSIENVLHPSETNIIENYECFQVVGFGKNYKNEKMHANENRPKNEV